jgi:hypothetical protein
MLKDFGAKVENFESLKFIMETSVDQNALYLAASQTKLLLTDNWSSVSLQQKQAFLQFVLGFIQTRGQQSSR